MNVSSDAGEDIETLMGFWLEEVILPLVGCLGVAGNVLCLFVFSNKHLDLKPAFSNILKCLSVFDIIFLICVMWLYTLPAILPAEYRVLEANTTPYILPLTHIALTGSVYSVVAVSLERFYNICKPFKRNLGSIMNGQGYIFTIIVFSLAYNIVKFFEFETVITEVEDEVTGEILRVPEMNLTVLRNDPVYATPLLIINTLVVGVIPIILLSYLNFRIIRTMNKTTFSHNKICTVQRQNNTMTALLTGIVLVLVICHSPKAVINIYECYQMILYGELRFTPLWGRLTIKLSHLLLCLSSAVNIIIYSYKMFRQARYVILSPGASAFFFLSALGNVLRSFSLSRLETLGDHTELEADLQAMELFSSGPESGRNKEQGMEQLCCQAV